jgi:uncharacterized protein (TIGR02246 family)
MRRRIATHLFVVGTLIGSGSAFGQTADADRKAIRSEWEGWIKVAESGDADHYMKYLTDDAVIIDMAEGQAPIVGSKAIAPWVKDFFARFTFTWTEQSQEIVVVGDRAFRRYTGVATFTPKAGGDPSRNDRKYLDVLRRGPDGRWRVSHHVFTLNR